MNDLRSLDHFAIAVNDADAAGAAYERLGFQVLPLMRHIELGTCNRVVQLEGTYLELIAGFDNAPPSLRGRLLPRYACGEGLAIVSLTSSDLLLDQQRIAATAWVSDPIVNARRKIHMPSGVEDETDSRCFYVWRSERIFSTLFYSEHRKPATIWIKEYQHHPNTAKRVTSLIYLSDDPSKEIEYVTALLGTQPARIERGGVRFVTARDETIEYLSHGMLVERFGGSAPGPCATQPVLGVAVSIAVADLEACAARLSRNGVDVQELDDRLIVPPVKAGGVLIEFHR